MRAGRNGDGCAYWLLNEDFRNKGQRKGDHFVQQSNGNKGSYPLRVGDRKLHHDDSKTATYVVVERKLANTKVPPFLFETCFVTLRVLQSAKVLPVYQVCSCRSARRGR